MADDKCARCAGCGQIADSADGEPWIFWEELPAASRMAVNLGLVQPIPCPACGATHLGLDAPASTDVVLEAYRNHDKLMHEEVARLRNALEMIAAADYRGPEPASRVLARRTLDAPRRDLGFAEAPQLSEERA